MSAAVVIPARYGSTRFPGKPLMRGPDGKCLIQYVWEAAAQAQGVAQVVIATDDDRIAAAVRAFGGEIRMTSADHHSGSDRCAEVAASMPHDVIVNLQGDEPAILPEMIARTVSLLAEDPGSVISTLASPITDNEELCDPSVVKVVLGAKNRALYFSRSIIPHVRGSTDPIKDSPIAFLRHHGIYGYRKEFLLAFRSLPPHPLEEAEKLEQLRALANGYNICVGIVSHRPLKVDTPADFEAFCRWKSRG